MMTRKWRDIIFADRAVSSSIPLSMFLPFRSQRIRIGERKSASANASFIGLRVNKSTVQLDCTCQHTRIAANNLRKGGGMGHNN